MQVFRSKIDTLLGIFFIALFVAPIIMLLQVEHFVLNNEDMLGALITLAVAIFLGVLIAKLKYVVDGDELRIEAVIFNQTIPLKNIRKVTKKTSWLSGPALSSKRLVLHCSVGEVEISPKDQTAFLRAINKPLSDSL